jgi:hypothetical protein
VNVARVTGLDNPFLTSQYKYIKSWWVNYLTLFQGIHFENRSFPTDGTDEENLNNTIFLPGYMGTRELETYSFVVDSGRSALFPIFFESLSMSIHNGERSDLYEFHQIDRDVSQ